MNSKQRLLAALRHEPVDRVPFNITYYMPAFYRLHFAPQPGQTPRQERLESLTRFGFDALVGLGGGVDRSWRLHEPGRWEGRREGGTAEEGYLATYIIETPAGRLSTVYNEEPGMSGWQVAPLIKEEEDLAALDYLPIQQIDVARINENRRELDGDGLGYVSINGIWQQACYLRGMEEMSMDPFLRPEWAQRFLGRVADDLAAQAEALCCSDAECFFINESYLGMGVSKQMFEEVIRPHDQRFIDIAKRAGKYVLYHDCGMCTKLLESFADMGIDYLEPLNPKSASGDVDPLDAKRRIGDRVCLRGGFNHQLLTYGTVDEVRQEVRDCLDKLSPGGGYMLCPAGPLDDDVKWENFVAFAEAAAELCPEYGNL